MDNLTGIKRARVNGLGISSKQKRSIKLFLIAVPFLLYIFAFSYIPLFGWIYAFFDFSPFLGPNIFQQQFVGFAKFAQLWIGRNELFRVLRNTIVMSILSLATTPLPVVLAILLSEVKSKRFKKFIQTSTTFPNFISWIIVFGIAYSIFSTNGLYAMLVQKLGGTPPAVGMLGNNNAVWIFQILMSIWKNLGWGAIIYVAAISGIDQELYEAAKIDGANRFKCIRHVTVPGISSTYLVLFLLAVSNILNNGFDQFFVFYNSMVANRIEVLDLYTYKVGIQLNDYDYSIAIGITKSLISIALLFIANNIAKRVRGASLI